MATSNDTTLKLCSRCDTEYPLTTEFWYRDKNRPSGLSAYCKSCCKALVSTRRRADPEAYREQRKARYWSNPEHERALKRQHRANNPEVYRERDRRYAASHREEAKARVKAWALANPERKRDADRDYHKRTYNVVVARESVKAWREAHPEGARAQLARRRALIRNAPGTFTAADVRLQIKTQTDKHGRLRCWWCGKPIEKYHVDHVVPLARGGSNAPENIVISCPVCNTSRQDKLPQEWNGRLL